MTRAPICCPIASTNDRLEGRLAQRVPVLMLSSDEAGAFGSASGYTPLTRLVPGARLLTATRRAARSLPARVANGCLSHLAVSRWYRVSSLGLEARAWWELQRGFAGIVHLLWGERDLGFLDLVPRRRHRVCCTFHACDDTLPSTLVRRSRLRKLDGVIIVSETQREFFLRCGVSPDRIHFCPVGIDTTTFYQSRRRLDGEFTVLSVGSYRRRYDRLREVAQSLRGLPGIRFVVVGPKHLAGELGSEPNVVVRSGLSTAELVQAYQDASCFLLTVENATANCALLEAMACGLPVVGGAVGGVPEYLGPDAGILCPPDRPGAIATAIESLLRSPGTRAAMGDAARRRAEELAWPNVALRMTEIYDHLASRLHQQ